ncbi:MAG: ATP-dependent DNA helicase RecG [Candidatus Omnitrophota bacterium]|nr:ATP-dependent DNA helicase RecG [Candidatus Omnitrophota bacterium]
MQEKKELLNTKIQYLKGVGPRRAEQLARLSISTIYDLLYYLPRRYEDRREIVLIRDVQPEKNYTVKGTIKRHGIWKSKKGMLIFDMVVSDGTGTIHAVWYNQPYLRKYFKVGEEIILYGKVEKFKDLQITHPDYEILKKEEDLPDTLNMGRIVPIYPLTQDITQKYLRSLVDRAIESNAGLLMEMIPTHVRARCRLADVKFAVNNIHFPPNFESLKMAERRLVFEEFFIFEAALALIKKEREKHSAGVSHKVEEGLFENFKNMLPFELTKEQVEAIKSIEKDMKSSSPMNRLLEGEVGSGKTIVAMYALLLTIKNNFQGAVMVPTEILAQQHHLTLSDFFAPFGINVRLLIGSMTSTEKAAVRKELKTGEINIIVGTHSLIQEDISFDNLGLLVIDEQHKFGVSQRALLKKRNVKADVLIMTATPIPRTLALTVYGDLDVSEMRDLPEGRESISTYWVEEDRKDKVYKFAKEEILNGRQVYTVCPRIEETGKNDLASAKSVYEHLSKEVFPEFKSALIHGRMKAAEKDKVMKDFKKNKINILVSTTVVEVGIDIPNATVMVIEDADRFGLAQLHQLRGRIGRGSYKSYCILISNPENEEAKRRLEAFERLESGFELAEEDFSIRGPGQILGTKQHGLPEIRFGDIIEDKAILELARKEAFELVDNDNGLKDERNRNLREAILERYRGKTDFLKVG